MISNKHVFLIGFTYIIAMTSICLASEDACRVPDNALFEKEEIRHTLPEWYKSGVIWFAGLTLSNTYNEVTDGTASITIDYVTVFEECSGNKTTVLHEEYSTVPPVAAWFGWYYRNPWFGNDDANIKLYSSISDGALIIPVSTRPDRVAHWWTERFYVKQGCNYSVEIRFKITGNASLNIGMDWWIDMTSGWNRYDATCATSNNCEAWFSDWFSSTNDEFIIITVPYNSSCKDVPVKPVLKKINMAPINFLLMAD